MSNPQSGCMHMWIRRMGLVIKKKRPRMEEDKEESHRENPQSWFLNVERIYEELPAQCT